MDNYVQDDMDWSSRLFHESVWPLVMPFVGGGELIQMEGRPDAELASLLDMRSGIDGWQLHAKGLRGIASRIQCGQAYNSFTIRMSRDSGAATEYAKRLDAIQSGSGWIYPHLTVQAYTETKSGPILSVGVARTADIIAFIQAGFHALRRTNNAEFAVCYWVDLVNRGYRVKIVEGVK